MADATKTNWADDVDEAEALPAKTETVGADGVITVVEWKFSDDGKKVKVTRRIKRVLSKQAVSHIVAERKSWAKFGAERGNAAGPAAATTTVAENMQFKLAAGKAAEETKEPEDDGKGALKVKKIVCRLCKGDHFTSKCPYKETLAGLGDDTATPDFGADPLEGSAPAPGGGAGGLGGPSKYVPPSMRGGPGAALRGPSEGSRYPGGAAGGAGREELPTLRVTNVAEDVEEEDLRDLFERAVKSQRNNRVARVYIGKDRETGVKKGFAFVSFESRECAEYARGRVDGQGFSNLILNVAFSQPREPRPAA